MRILRIPHLIVTWLCLVTVSDAWLNNEALPQSRTLYRASPLTTRTAQFLSADDTTRTEQHHESLSSRRQWVRNQVSRVSIATLTGALSVLQPGRTWADTTTNEKYQKKTDKFGYEFQVPDNFEAGNKPLKTHLDEVNFKSSTVTGFQFGITVDPVRISSLAQFGTADEVAAKVVMAEVNRDGVFEVKLMEDARAAPNDVYYILNYLSHGKRGDKRFVTKFYIQNQMLYALTAQCKEADYPKVEQELLQAVESFQPV